MRPYVSSRRGAAGTRVGTVRYLEAMSGARKNSAVRVARGGGSLSPKTAKLVSSVSKRAGKSAATIRQKHAG